MKTYFCKNCGYIKSNTILNGKCERCGNDIILKRIRNWNKFYNLLTK